MVFESGRLTKFPVEDEDWALRVNGNASKMIYAVFASPASPPDICLAGVGRGNLVFCGIF